MENVKIHFADIDKSIELRIHSARKLFCILHFLHKCEIKKSTSKYMHLPFMLLMGKMTEFTLNVRLQDESMSFIFFVYSALSVCFAIRYLYSLNFITKPMSLREFSAQSASRMSY